MDFSWHCEGISASSFDTLAFARADLVERLAYEAELTQAKQLDGFPAYAAGLPLAACTGKPDRIIRQQSKPRRERS
ncbi:hypothetical protein NKG99_07050 [Mesorhizobium sp. M1409]|uniref:hypothetical protein n=1 Tax=unclassified Mesorhizobium TaxID=325217 RepID=UPI0033379417